MNRQLWGDKRYYRDLLTIGAPIILQTLLSTIAAAIDTAMISGISMGDQRELAVAAVGVASQFSALLASAHFGFIYTGMLFFAQYHGANDEKGILKSYGLALTLVMAVALIFAAFATLKPEAVMSLYASGDKAELRAVGAQYLRIVGFSFPLQVMGLAMAHLLRCIEKARIPMFAYIASVLTNTALNWILIYGKFGAPALGVRGAAIATLISTALPPAIMWCYSTFDKTTLLTRVREQFGWSREFVRVYFKKGFFIVLNEALYGFGQMLINRILGYQEMTALAALIVYRNIEGIIYAFFGGFAGANSVIIGKEVGAGELQRAHGNAKRMAWQCPLVTALICCVVLLMRPLIARGYNMSPETRGYFFRMIEIFLLTGTIRTANFIMNNTFRAGGDPVIGAYLEASFLLVFTVPLVYVVGLALKSPFLIVFAAMFVEEFIKLPIEARYLRSGRFIKPVTEIGRARLGAFVAFQNGE